MSGYINRGFKCGDLVRERDGRHVGRVQAIKWSRIVVIRWESGWISEILIEEVERERL
jgi:hypothetical protein